MWSLFHLNLVIRSLSRSVRVGVELDFVHVLIYAKFPKCFHGSDKVKV